MLSCLKLYIKELYSLNPRALLSHTPTFNFFFNQKHWRKTSTYTKNIKINQYKRLHPPGASSGVLYGKNKIHKLKDKL